MIREKVAGIFRDKLNVDVPSDDIDLIANGIMDSMMLVELIVHLESEFDVTPSLDELEVENFATVARIAAFLESRIAARARG